MTTDEVKTLLSDIAKSQGVELDNKMDYLQMAQRLKERMTLVIRTPAPKANWAQAITVIVGILAMGVAAWAAYSSSESAKASRDSAKAAETNVDITSKQYEKTAKMVADEVRDKTDTGLQQVVIYDMLEQGGEAGQ